MTDSKKECIPFKVYFSPLRNGSMLHVLVGSQCVTYLILKNKLQVKGDPSKKELKKDNDEKSSSGRNPGEKKMTSSDKASK